MRIVLSCLATGGVWRRMNLLTPRDGIDSPQRGTKKDRKCGL
jgi:hypothetical protein